MKKIVILNGSPHEHGGTSALAGKVVKSAEALEYRILVAGGTHLPEQVLCQTDVMKQAQEMGKWLSE